MGVGWTVAHRANVLSGNIVSGSGDVNSRADAIVTDGPAAFRRLMLRPQTAVAVAKQFVKQLCVRAPFKTLSGVVVSVIFDEAAKMPPQRALVAASRAKANPPDPDGPRLDPKKLSPGHLQEVLNWDPLLAHSTSKKAVWELLGRAVFEQLCAHDGCIVEVITAGAMYVRDLTKVLPVRRCTSHGEADLLVATRASDFAAVGRTVEIVTVDYDQILQSLVAPTGESFATAVRFKAELVNIPALIKTYGGNCRSRRLSAAFFMLCAFKSDYSKSLCRPTGSRVNHFVSAMTEGTVAITETFNAETGARTMMFRPPAFLSVVKAWPHDVGHKTATAMLNNVLWTLAYFSGYDAYRPGWGGPPEINLEEKSAKWTLLREIEILEETFTYRRTTLIA